MKLQKSGSRTFIAATAAMALLPYFDAATAATITFDDLVTGATSYAFDGDGDGIKDVTFSTTDPAGFNTIGPGLNQSYISEPGLEGTSLLTTDLRVDFARNPTGFLSFGFALNSATTGSNYFANFRVYNSSGSLLGQSTVVGAYTTVGSSISSFPEGRLTVSFAGAASYGLFNFSSQFGRYIIDDFTGNFGSVIPEPSAASLLLVGLCALIPFARRASSRRVRQRPPSCDRMNAACG